MENENQEMDQTAGGTATSDPPDATSQGQTSPSQPTDQDIQPGKTYTDKQVQEIVQKRLKSWSEFGKPDEVRARLARHQELEKVVEDLRSKFGQNDKRINPNEPQLTEDDKKVRTYLEKVAPELFSYNKERNQLLASLQSFNNWQWQQISERNSANLWSLAEKEGYKPEHRAELEDRVRDSIIGNQEDFRNYLKTGDPKIVEKHFQAINKWIKSFGPGGASISDAANKAKSATRTERLAPRMPPGGAPTVTSGKRKMGDADRVQAAWDRFKSES